MELKIGNFMHIISYQGFLKAMEECEDRIINADRELESLFEFLDNLNNAQEIKNDIIDLLYATALAHYAKGIKDGKKLYL